MAITLETVQFLQSDVAQSELQLLVDNDLSAKYTLKILNHLRKKHTAEQAGWLLSQAQLRQKAVIKYGDVANSLLFDATALEQASDPLIRQYRAQSYTKQKILDVCCGIGSDTLAFAQMSNDVTGIDVDPVRIAIAKYNANQLNLDIHFHVTNANTFSTDGYDVIFFDPARRDANGKRIYDVEQYQPPLSLIQKWQQPIIVKISPGVSHEQLNDYNGTVEFISVDGALKEAVLYTQHSVWQSRQFVATRITKEVVEHFIRHTPDPQVEIAEPLGWLIEPDPAIIRSGFVQDIAIEYEGKLLDETIAYFTTGNKPNSVWLRAWRIRDWMPFNLKKLRSYLRERGISKITVKKRGSPITPEQLIQQLKLKKGDKSATLVLTRYANNPIVIICDDIAVT